MSVKQKLESALTKLKTAGRKVLKLLIVAALAGSAIGGLGVVAANAPYLHKTWIRNKVGNEVVMIIKRDEQGRKRGGGTGFHVMSPSGVTYILTNAHVCEMYKAGDDALIQQHGDGRLIPRRVIEISDKTDLCLIEGLPNHTGLKVASSTQIGDSLAIVGHPVLQPLSISIGDVIGLDLIEFPYAELVPDEAAAEADGRNVMTEAQCKSKPKFKVGEIPFFFGIKVKVCLLSINAYQTTIVAYPGNSGSPAVNFWGNVGGVLYAGSGYTNYGYLITLKDIQEFLAPY